jgi:hypothetical protein
MGCSTRTTRIFALLRMPPGKGALTPEIFIGLSGMCVAINTHKTKCIGHFPYQFNQELVNGALKTIPPHEYVTPISKIKGEPVPHLAIALASLLLFSICLSLISIVISLSRDSGFSRHVIIAAVPDLLVMIGSGVIVGLVVYGYPKAWAAPHFHTGAYLMYAAFGARIMSHPLVTKVFLKLCAAPLRMLARSQTSGPTFYSSNQV